MKTVKTVIGELESIKGVLKEETKTLELKSPRTPEIEKKIAENKKNIMMVNHAINQQRIKHYFKPVIEKKKMAEGYQQEQANKRSKRTTWKGLNPDERAKRNKKIYEHFKKSRLTINSFAKKHFQKYDLSISQITKIIRKYCKNFQS